MSKSILTSSTVLSAKIHDRENVLQVYHSMSTIYIEGITSRSLHQHVCFRFHLVSNTSTTSGATKLLQSVKEQKRDRQNN